MSGEVLTGELVPFPNGDHAGVAVPGVPDGLAEHVARWLAAVTGPDPSPHTLRAYVTDSGEWFAWCTAHHVDPLAVVKSHVDVYAKSLATTPTRRTGRPPKPATVARKVAAIASLYGYLVDEDLVEALPVRKRARPTVSNISTTRGLSRHEAQAFRGRLVHESPTDRAVVETLIGEGLRVSELCGADVESVRVNAGAVTLTVHGKGAKTRELVLSAPVVASIEVMLTDRAALAGLDGVELLDPAGPLFVRSGGARWDQRSVCRLLVRIARAAGITRPDTITPHVLRHSCATLMLDAGVSLHVVRDQLGHAATSTTERYDRARGALSRTGVHALAAWTQPEPED